MVEAGVEYSNVTELPGNQLSSVALDMIRLRYSTALRYGKGKKILEVGCGPGLGAQYLCKNGVVEYTGIDINPASIQLAKGNNNRIKNVDFFVGDAHQLPFENDQFDVLTCFETLFYFKDINKCIKEMRRVLKPGGELVLCIPNKEIKGFLASPFSLQYFTNRELKNLIKQEFKNVSVFGAFPLQGSIAKEARYLRIKLAQAFNIFPQAQLIKKTLKRHLMGERFILPQSIDVPSNFNNNLVPLNDNAIDRWHKLLYCIAR